MNKEPTEAEAARAAESPWLERIARFGLVAQGISFGLVAVLAIEVALGKARGLDGAQRKLAHHPYGEVLLAVVAAGLFAYGVFCLIQARYREV